MKFLKTEETQLTLYRLYFDTQNFNTHNLMYWFVLSLYLVCIWFVFDVSLLSISEMI